MVAFWERNFQFCYGSLSRSKSIRLSKYPTMPQRSALKAGKQIDHGQDSLQRTVVAYVSLHLSSPGAVLAWRDPR